VRAGSRRRSKSDPNKLLQGSGKTVRHVVLNTVADFDRAEIEAPNVLLRGAAGVRSVELRGVPGRQ
jgi:hypothetical protein